MIKDRYDDLAAFIDEARARPGQGRPERTEYVPMRGHLQADIDDLQHQLRDLQQTGGDSMEADPRTAEIQARLDELTEQLRDSVRPLRLRALPRPEFRALVDKHPPRRIVGDDGIERPHPHDRQFNTDTFYQPLIKASIVKPELNDEQLDYLVDVMLSDAYFTRLGVASLSLNTMELDIPFSRAGSPSSPTSDGGSQQPAG